jgi:hypothetical protein
MDLFAGLVCDHDHETTLLRKRIRKVRFLKAGHTSHARFEGYGHPSDRAKMSAPDPKWTLAQLQFGDPLVGRLPEGAVAVVRSGTSIHHVLLHKFVPLAY